MFNSLSRRQLLQIGSGFAAIAATNTLWSSPALSQPRETLYVQERYLYDSSGQKIILRGINLPLLDNWEFQQDDKLEELAKTGANVVRIQWYQEYPPNQPPRPAYSLQDLDNFLTKCKENRIIPILGLWDLTCEDDVSLLNTRLIPWWISDDVLFVLKKHQQYLIINLANELGKYRWLGSSPAALETFKTAYKSAIMNIRQHLRVPIMIDAPDCGQSIEVFTMIGQELIDHDPDHNLLLSAHAYWTSYDGMRFLGELIQARLPIVFGEVANKQDGEFEEKPLYCYHDLDCISESERGFTYQILLEELTRQEIGWLAWCWWKDHCSPRLMTLNGNFANLTHYGDDLVNNPIYGLKITAQRSNAFG